MLTASHHHPVSQFNANSSSTLNGEACELQEESEWKGSNNIGSIVLPGTSVFYAVRTELQQEGGGRSERNGKNNIGSIVLPGTSVFYAHAISHHQSHANSSEPLNAEAIEVKEYTTVSNQFKLKRGKLLGQGAFGHVYRGSKTSSTLKGGASELQEHAGRSEWKGKCNIGSIVAFKNNLSVITDHEDEANDATRSSTLNGELQEQDGRIVSTVISRSSDSGTNPSNANCRIVSPIRFSGSGPSEFKHDDEANDATRNQSEGHRVLLGEGGFGSVYKGFHSETGQICAIKEILRHAADNEKSEECLKQLVQEKNILSQLSHPNIVKYYGSKFGKEGSSIYMEYVSCGSIYDILREHVRLEEHLIQRYTKQILAALAYLHDRNIVHRDIKAANILVNDENDIKLADFGLARHINSSSKMYSCVGSRYWMAPEMVNRNGYTITVDVWSLGCTILEMATGSPPWSEYKWEVAKEKIRNSKDMPAIPNHLSDCAKSFIRLCLKKNPRDRPSAHELLKQPFIQGC